MNHVKFQEMNTLLQSFQLRDLQSFKNICIILAAHEKTIPDALEYITARVTPPKPMKKECPDCSGDMYLYSVNTSPRNQVGGSHKTQWYCNNCGFSIFSSQTIKEQVENMRRLNNGTR